MISGAVADDKRGTAGNHYGCEGESLSDDSEESGVHCGGLSLTLKINATLSDGSRKPFLKEWLVLMARGW